MGDPAIDYEKVIRESVAVMVPCGWKIAWERRWVDDPTRLPCWFVTMETHETLTGDAICLEFSVLEKTLCAEYEKWKATKKSCDDEHGEGEFVPAMNEYLRRPVEFALAHFSNIACLQTRNKSVISGEAHDDFRRDRFKRSLYVLGEFTPVYRQARGYNRFGHFESYITDASIEDSAPSAAESRTDTSQ